MMRRSLLVLATATLLSGCASWFSGSSGKEPAELKDFKQSSPLRVSWSASIADSQDGMFTPALAGNAWVTAGSNGRLYLVDAVSGRSLRKLDLDQTLVAGVAAGTALYFVANDKGQLLAVDGNGKVAWTQTLTSLPVEPPVAVGDRVVVKGGDGRVSAFAQADGKPLWTQASVLPALTVRATTPSMLVLGGDVIVAGQSGGRLNVYNLASGKVVFDASIAQPRGATELERVTDVVSRPAFDGRRLCAVAYQGRVACLDSRSGSLLWARDFGSSRGLALDGRAVYATDDDGVLWAFDIDSGRNLWRNDDLKYRGVTAPVLLGNDLLVADAGGYAHLISHDDGRLLARVKTGAEGVLSQPLVQGDTAYVQGRNGRLVALTN